MLDKQRFFIKQQVAMLATTDTYDILDPDTQKQIGVAKEEPGSMVAILRIFLGKKLMPTKVEVREYKSNKLLFTIHRGVSLFTARVDVKDGEGKLLGYFKSKLLSFTGGFWVYDDQDQQFAELKGNWTAREFKFLTADGTEIGSVGKKWAGLAKELFTTADNYMVAINDDITDTHSKILMLAACLAIDMVFYEQGK